MTVRSIRTLSHDHKLATALGNMVVAWAYGEMALLGAMARITGMRINMAQDGYYRIPIFEARVKFILALIPQWDTKEFNKEEITTAVEKLSKLSSTRNHWIHGDWCHDNSSNETIVFDHRATLDKRRRPVKAHDVNHHTQTVLSRADDIFGAVKFHELPI